MRHPIIRLFVMLAAVITAGCGFHPRGTTQVPTELRTLVLETGDPYGPLTRVVRQQLRINNVNIVEATQKNSMVVPTLRLGGNLRVEAPHPSSSAAPPLNIRWRWWLRLRS